MPSPHCPFLPQDYSVEGMSDSLLNFLQHLREFGLVFQRKVHTPSHLASRRVGYWVQKALARTECLGHLGGEVQGWFCTLNLGICLSGRC